MNEIVKYILATFKISKEELISQPKYYVKEILQMVRRNNAELSKMKRERDDKYRDMQFLESSMVSGINYDGNQSGRNTGGKPNNVELKQLQLAEIREAIRSKIIEIQLLEKSLNDHNKIAEEFIRKCTNQNQANVLVDKYIFMMRDIEIAKDNMYSEEWVRQTIMRGIRTLSEYVVDSVTDLT